MEKDKRKTIDINEKSLPTPLVPSKDKKPKVVVDNPHISDMKVMTDVGLIAIIDIDEVNPYDSSHFPFGDPRWKKQDKVAEEHNEPNWNEFHHREGVDKLKEVIKKGYIVRPILVFNGFRREHMISAGDAVDWKKIRYQRLDGFKRYMALKELGYKWITVQILATWVGEAQVNQPWVL